MPGRRTLFVGSRGETTLAGRRPDNQDRLARFYSPAGEVLVLADGMGGHLGGALAAQMATTEFPLHFRTLEGRLPLEQAIAQAAQRVNAEIYNEGNQGDPNLRKMGATLIVAVVSFFGDEGELVVAHAGDSRAYLFRAGALQLLTRDHTVAAQLEANGLIGKDAVRDHPDSHVLTRSLGQTPDLKLDFTERIKLAADDGILLCTDGLTHLSDQQINKILEQHTDAKASASALAEAAFAAGSQDNISLHYLRIAEQISGPRVGTHIGSYVLERFLGAGGMGEVWLGRHRDLGIVRAIKIMGDWLGHVPDIRTRFLQEGQQQAQLDHPAIVKVIGYDETVVENEPVFFLTLEYIEGESLRARIERMPKTPLADEQFLRIAYRMLDALEFAHEHQMVHRDVKSSNILLDKDGNAYLSDFGLVISRNRERLTMAGAVVGDSSYISPEQFLEPDMVDQRSDIYSFGCVLYEMLAGRTPFAHHSDDFALKMAHKDEMPPSLRRSDRRISKELEAVVLRALEKKQADRWQTCGELRAALQAAEAGMMPKSPALTVGRFVKSYRWLILLTVVVIACGTGLGIWNQHSERTAKQLATFSGRLYKSGNRTVAALMALESLRTHRTIEGQDSLLRALSGLGRVGKVLINGREPNFADLAFSPDGKRLAFGLAAAPGSIAGTPDSIGVLDVNSGRIVSALASPSGEFIKSFAWSPDSSQLAAVYRYSAGLWKIGDSRPRFIQVKSDARVEILAWSPDGSSVVSVGRSPSLGIQVWNSNDGGLLNTLPVRHNVISLIWSPPMSSFAGFGDDGEIQTWDPQWHLKVRDRLPTEEQQFTSATFSSKRFAFALKEGVVVVYPLNGSSPELNLKCKANGDLYSRLHPISLSPDGDLLACAEGNDITIWDPASDRQTPLRVYEDSAIVQSVAWSPDARQIASVNAEGTVRLWDASAGPIVSPLLNGVRAYERIAWSPDGARISVVYGGQASTLIASTGTLVREFGEAHRIVDAESLKGEENRVRKFGEAGSNVAADGSHLVSAQNGDLIWTENSDLKIWSTYSGLLVKTARIPAGRTLLAVGPQARELAWLNQRRIEFRNASDDRLLWALEHEIADQGKIPFLAWSPDGKLIAIFGRDGANVVQVRAASDGRISDASLTSGSLSGAWSPDSRFLATADTLRDRIEIWDCRTHSLTGVVHTRSIWPGQPAWSSDGQIAVSNNFDQKVRIFKVSTGELIRTIDENGPISALAWGPANKLAIGFPNRGVEIWNLEEKVIENAACDYITRNLTPEEWNEFLPGTHYHQTCAIASPTR